MLADLEELSVLSQKGLGDISNRHLSCPKQNTSGICPDKLVWSTARLGKTLNSRPCIQCQQYNNKRCRFIERG
jgi:hypothetical protein